VVGNELIERVELDHPEEVLARVVSEHLEVLHVDAAAVVDPVQHDDKHMPRTLDTARREKSHLRIMMSQMRNKRKKQTARGALGVPEEISAVVRAVEQRRLGLGAADLAVVPADKREIDH
jgi:hypothetical protein